jgi:hypothetical protein
MNCNEHKNYKRGEQQTRIRDTKSYNNKKCELLKINHNIIELCCIFLFLYSVDDCSIELLRNKAPKFQLVLGFLNFKFNFKSCNSYSRIENS